MTFLESIKNEIIENMPKKPCCRRSMLFGMLAARGSLNSDGSISLRLSHKQSLEMAEHLIKEQLGRNVRLLPSAHGGRTYNARFESNAARKLLEELETASYKGQCPTCSASFLRGLFLASGHITDPRKAYHLEFSLGERAEALVPVLAEELGTTPKVASRKNETLLYFKDSTAIEDALTVLGINDAAFLLMNQKIEKQFRNEANRRTNCEAGNITRAVNAAARTLSVLRRMEAEDMLSSLPEELYDIARLRLTYPEASLTQLASLTTPPLTKSGVNHRLQKILEIAEKRSITPDA